MRKKNEYEIDITGGQLPIQDFLKLLRRHKICYSRHPTRKEESEIAFREKKAFEISRDVEAHGGVTGLPFETVTIYLSLPLIVALTTKAIDIVYDWYKERKRQDHIIIKIKTEKGMVELNAKVTKNLKLLYEEKAKGSRSHANVD